MKRVCLLIVTAVPLLTGQMCGTSDPGLNSQGLTPGLYTGTNAVETTVAYYGENAPAAERYEAANDAMSLTISPAGLPCSNKGQELAPGVTDSTSAGGSTLELTVTSVSMDIGKVSVKYSVSYAAEVPDQEPMVLTGPGTVVFLQEGNQLTANGTYVLSGTWNHWTVNMTLKANTTLTH